MEKVFHLCTDHERCLSAIRYGPVVFAGGSAVSAMYNTGPSDQKPAGIERQRRPSTWRRKAAISGLSQRPECG